MQETFRLVYTGRLAAGKIKDEVKGALSSKLKISEQAINTILSSNSIVLKKNMNANQAQQYQKAFESAGLICRIDTEAPSATPPGHIECPKCGHQQPKADECVKCGVIISKAQDVKKQEKARLKSLEAAKPFQDLLTEYKEMLISDRIFYNPSIPAKKRRAASNAYGPWPSSETPLFLYDNSVNKNDAQGLVITNRGLYGKGNFGKPYFYTLNNLGQADVKLGLSGGLHFGGTRVNDLAFMSSENRMVFSEMLHDLTGEKRVLIPFGQEINVPQQCCGCLAPTSGQEVTVRLLSKPPKSEGSKAAGFLADAFLFNLSPVAFLIVRGLADAAKAAAGDGFMPGELKLPYCSNCIPTNYSAGQLMDELETWSGNTLEARGATVKASFAWFDVVFKNPQFADKLTELNPHTIFPSWIKMSTHKAEDAPMSTSATEDVSGKPKVEGPPVHHAKFFASLVEGLSYFAAEKIPEKKLKNALASFASLGPEEKVVGLHDSTVFGSAKEGVVFTDQGLYWKGGKTQGSILYKDIDPNQIKHSSLDGLPTVEVGPEICLPFSALRMKELEWVVKYLRRVCR